MGNVWENAAVVESWLVERNSSTVLTSCRINAYTKKDSFSLSTVFMSLLASSRKLKSLRTDIEVCFIFQKYQI